MQQAKIGIFIAALVPIILYLTLEYNYSFFWLFICIYLEILVLLFLSSLVFKKLRAFIIHIKRRKFNAQILLLMSAITIIPALLILIFSTTIFQRYTNKLFHPPIKTVIDKNFYLINAHLQEKQSILKFYTHNFANNIQTVQHNIADIQNEINNICTRNQLDILLFKIENGFINTIASSLYSLSIQYLFPLEIIINMPINIPISYFVDNYIVSVLRKENDVFFAFATPIDPDIISIKHQLQIAEIEYQSLFKQYRKLQFVFILLFLSITVLLLSIVLYLAFKFASSILLPITHLINGAENICNENYVSVPYNKPLNNELETLINVFNNMVQQIKKQKIETKQTAWKDLSRKMAHEIKNPLTPILLSAERLKNNYNKEGQLRPEVFNNCINTIIRQVTCISNLVKEFSNFARMPAPIFDANNIIEILQDVIFIQANANENIIFYFQKLTGYIYCECDALQINQVFINLIQNAINAINENINYSTDYVQFPASSFVDYETSCIKKKENMFKISGNNKNYLIQQGIDIATNSSEYQSSINSPQNENTEKVRMRSNFQHKRFIDRNNKNENHLASYSLCSPRDDYQTMDSDNVQNIILIKNTNCIKNTRDIGKILVTCSNSVQGILITIEDNGPGFSEKALKCAFDPYFTTRKNGTGLGLSIVYKIIFDHKGTINIGKSEILSGAKISVNIPHRKNGNE